MVAGRVERVVPVEPCHNAHLIGHKVTIWGPSLHRSTWQMFGSGTVGSEKVGCSVGAGVGFRDGICVGTGMGPGVG